MRSLLLTTAALGLLGAASAQDVQNIVLYDGVSQGDLTFSDLNTRKILFNDFDNDGDLDLFCFNFEAPASVFVNDGAGNLTLDTDGNSNNQLDNIVALPVKGASFFDYNNDGFDDIALAVGKGSLGNPRRNIMMLSGSGQVGPNDPRYVEAGYVGGPDGEQEHSYDIAMLDVNGGSVTGAGSDVVLIVANRKLPGFPDLGRNRLYRGQGGGLSFAVAPDDTSELYTDGPFSSRDIAVGDLDGNGRDDVFISNAGNGDQPNGVYLNVLGDFINSNDASITGNPGNSYGAALGDLDADGDLDIVVGNRQSATVGEANFLIRNDSAPFAWSGTFVTGSPITDDVDPTYDVAIGDLDGDSDLDVVAANNAFANRVYMNNLADDPAVTSETWFSAPTTSVTRLTHGAILLDRGRTRSVTIGEVFDYSGNAAHQGAEVALANAQLGGGEFNFYYRSFGRMFSDVGGGSATTTQPRLSGDGFVSPSSDASLFAEDAEPLASFQLFGTLSPTAVPFNGGTNFVNDQLGVPLVVGSSDGLGNIDVAVPAGSVPSVLEGVPVVFQLFTDDDSLGALQAMSNGLSVVLQN